VNSCKRAFLQMLDGHQAYSASRGGSYILAVDRRPLRLFRERVGGSPRPNTSPQEGSTTTEAVIDMAIGAASRLAWHSRTGGDTLPIRLELSDD